MTVITVSVYKLFRCVRKDSYLGHHTEGASAQVRVHPYFGEDQGHCMDRGQQEDCCGWGWSREVSISDLHTMNKTHVQEMKAVIRTLKKLLLQQLVVLC